MKKRGKIKQKKGQHLLPREEWVYGSTSGIVSSVTIQMDPATKQLKILEVDPSTIRRQITHKRTGKDDKIIYSAPSDDFSLSLTDFSELQNRFHYLMAVDTNTLNDVHQGYRISACCIYVVNEPLQALSSEIPYRYHASYLILNTDHQAKSEALGWHLAISHSISRDFIQRNRVGLIVDSELGKHVSINAYKEPYYETINLPPTMQLIYASSDKSANFTNDMIRHCDAGAKEVLKDFQSRDIEELLKCKSISIGTALCFPIKALNFSPSSADTEN